MERHIKKDVGLENRKLAAKKYQPDKIKLLLIAEAPPKSEDRYFYYENVTEQDSLFRYVVRCVLNTEPIRDQKAEQLNALKNAGVFLIDSVTIPLQKGEKLKDFINKDSLVSRCQNLNPQAIVLIKANVYDEVFDALKNEGLPVVDERIPFPGSGQQTRFVNSFNSALRKIGQ